MGPHALLLHKDSSYQDATLRLICLGINHTCQGWLKHEGSGWIVFPLRLTWEAPGKVMGRARVDHFLLRGGPLGGSLNGLGRSTYALPGLR
jgi:hypothetical protein